MTQTRQMKLGAFLYPYGHHIAAWRDPAGPIDASINFPSYIELAKTAERGLFDLIFMADSVTVAGGDNESLRRLSYVAWIDPFTLLSGLAAVTSRIGLVCTATTTFDQPYLIARRFASLDLTSGGRAGWNLVTSSNPNEASNFGLDKHMATSERYERAFEFAQIVRGLWKSWDDDAFVRDREACVFSDPEKLHVLDHRGRFYKVRGPLNVARSPQGQPVMVQAGASEDGKNLAAETAEVVFTAQPTLNGAKEFYDDLKSRVSARNRDPDDLKIMPGFFITVGRSKDEAIEKYDRLQKLIHPEVGVKQLYNLTGFDFSGYPIDGPVPDVPPTKEGSSRTNLLVDMARRNGLTIRQLYERIAGGRGHYQVCGSPKDVADEMERWFVEGAADGFNVMAPVLPDGLNDFVDLVIPELQRRKLFRTEYSGRTLRDHLGLRMQ
ncbi:MAG: LLM class flavin-dependent oxidoreductase [Rhizobiales bacterium]|nr:LLM class flavin-dependent oxidoreductase [Hyphomicrobiales bacterium]